MTAVSQKTLNDYAQDAGYDPPHMDAIIEAARWSEPEAILDIGTHFGSSAVHFKNAFPDARVVTVGDEIARGGWMGGSFDRAVERFQAHEMMIWLIKSDTRRCGEALRTTLQNKRIGFVFQDACHDFAGLLAEYGQFYPFLAPRHCIVMDDTSEDGVRAMAEWMTHLGYVYEIGTTFKGLAILKKEKE